MVGWDQLSASESVRPVVPGMNQQADGYFLNPQPTFEAPDPRAHLQTHDAYVAAGVDTYSITVRGGTHAEWSFIPLIIPATSYGVDTAGYYTLAWFDRYVHPSAERRRDATAALRHRAGPRPPHRREPTSGRGEPTSCPPGTSRRSASTPRAGSFDSRPLHEATDLRAYAGLSPVGDWAGANADATPLVLAPSADGDS